MKKIQFKSDKIEIHRSLVHGNGVFTKKDIKKGETIVILRGKERYSNIKGDNSIAHRDWIGIKNGVWIDPSPPLNYINHSCNPNVGIRGSRFFVALKDIKRGGEITIDYSITEGDQFWHLKCRCGAQNCRKIIGSIQSLPRRVFNKYLPFVPAYFKKIYLKYNNIG